MRINDILTHRRAPEWRAKFEALVRHGEPDECWEWQGAFDTTTGYGFVCLGKTHRTHRVAWVLANGPIPHKDGPRGYCICHHCDNRKCCNPKHLFLGTDRDNALDATRKGRMAQGEKHHAAKLTNAQVAAVRRDTRPVRVIAKELNVSASTVYGAQRRDTRKQAFGEPFQGARDRLPAKGTPRPRKTSVPDEVILAIRASRDTFKALGERHGLSTATVAAVYRGRLGVHLPLGEQIAHPRGRPRGPNYKGPAPAVGKLGMLRRAAETVLASRKEMDKGWFVPADAMQKLKEQIG